MKCAVSVDASCATISSTYVPLKGWSAESGGHACVLRHLRRCSQLTVSRFPVNQQSFRTYHFPQVTGIFPALSATLFGVSRCATHLYCSSDFGDVVWCVCLLLMSFLCFWATLCGV